MEAFKNELQINFDFKKELSYFQNCFCCLFSNKIRNESSVRIFIEQKLHQFNLKDRYETNDILLEVHERGLKAINKRKSIVYFDAWVKATAYNYIRELSRLEKKIIELPENFDLPDKLDYFSENNDIEYQLIKKAFQQLNREEKKLIGFYHIKEYSWKQIVDRYQSKGEYLSETSLRKRKERALKKLKQLYYSLKK